MEEKIMLSKEEYNKMVDKIKTLENYIERDDLILVPKDKNRVLNLYAHRYMKLENLKEAYDELNGWDIKENQLPIKKALEILSDKGLFDWTDNSKILTAEKQIKRIIYGLK